LVELGKPKFFKDFTARLNLSVNLFRVCFAVSPCVKMSGMQSWLHKYCFIGREMPGRSLDDSGLAATPRCRRPIVDQHPDDVTRDVTCRRDNNRSPSSTSSSSRESGIKSTTGSSSPERLPAADDLQRQQRQTGDTRTVHEDVPLDLSLTSSLPRQRLKHEDEATGVHGPTVASRFHGNDSWLSAVDHWWPPLLGGATLRDVTRCHDNGNPYPLLPLVDGQSPMLSGGGRWLLQPPTVFSQPPRCPSAPVPSVSPFQEFGNPTKFLIIIIIIIIILLAQ